MLPTLIILISLAAVVLFFALGRAAASADRRAARRRSDEYGAQRERYLYSVLRSYFPSRNVHLNLYFPVKKQDETLWTETDVTVVTRAGVCVIEVKGFKGMIDSPEAGDWTQRRGDKVVQFQNPREQNEGHVIAVRNALRRAGLGDVQVFNAVVFTEENVKFTQTHPWLFVNYQIIDYLAKLDDSNALTRKDVKSVNAALAPYAKKRNNTAARAYAKDHR